MQPKLKTQEIRQALLTGAKDDPQITFHLSKAGREILKDAAKSRYISVSQFIRIAILEKVQKILEE